MEYSQFSGHVQIIFQMTFVQKNRRKKRIQNGINTNNLNKESSLKHAMLLCDS